MTRIMICGSRTINSNQLVDYLINAAFIALGISQQEQHIIIHGAARGVDLLAADYAKQHRYSIEAYPADWEALGKGAGYVRNKTMVDCCDCAVALHDGISKGTQHSINLLAASGKPHAVVVYNAVNNSYVLHVKNNA